jgi:hypothetical protein
MSEKLSHKYKQLLARMFVIESVGESLYTRLKEKTEDTELKSIYDHLAKNESNTRKHIERELLKYDIPKPLMLNKVTLGVANLFFFFASGKMLERLLRRIMRRKLYSKWSDQFGSKNIELWNILLEHENLQCRMLGM